MINATFFRRLSCNLVRFLIATDWLFAGFTGTVGVKNIARVALALTLQKETFTSDLNNRTTPAYKLMKSGVVSAVSTTIVVVLLSMKSKQNI